MAGIDHRSANHPYYLLTDTQSIALLIANTIFNGNRYILVGHSTRVNDDRS